MIFLHLSVLSYCSRCSRLKADAVRYDGARASITVASHTRLLPAFHGIRVIPSGLFLFDRRSPCGGLVTADGSHGLSCGLGPGRFARHAYLNDIISRSLTLAGVPNIKEPPGISRTDGK